jgi:phosphatidylglycerol:prolipoprotein diacylglycerol transferase
MPDCLLLFSYIVWGPNREMFHFDLPLLNRPILWYGFFFAFGFFLGYLCLTYLLRRYFLFLTQIRKEDVIAWPDLIKAIAKQAYPITKAIFAKLGNPYKEWCQDWTFGKEIPKEQKLEILKAMNRVIADLELVFKVELPSSFKRLLSYAAKRADNLVSASIQKKLQLQQELQAIIVPLKQQTTKIAEQITFYVIIGTVVGARLGDVLLYQNWSEIARAPFLIIAVWQGGLASHGGAIGILIALWIFTKKRKMPFWRAVDFTVIPTAIAAVCIRIGNFFNQEILGVPTTLPWGIIFLYPADGGPIVPRHPAQLYEAIVYFCVFVILSFYWHRGLPFQKSGKLTGLFLVLVFTSRFLIEFLKVEQSVHILGGSFLTMGQWLSIPFILLGLWLFFRKSS